MNSEQNMKFLTKDDTFTEMVGPHCVYVDKTEYLYRLLMREGPQHYFIARPRRFGKSATVYALRELLQGKRVYFKDTFIGRSDYTWPTMPVVYLTFLGFSSFAEDLENALRSRIMFCMRDWEWTYREDLSPEDNFVRALEMIAKTYGPPAVLIDDYDYPVGYSLQNPECALRIEKRLKQFYTVLKRARHLIRFMFVTGVLGFGRHEDALIPDSLEDLTFNPEFAEMFGYTEQELTDYLDDHLRRHAEVMGLTYENYRTELRRQLGGWRFTSADRPLYHPLYMADILNQNQMKSEFGSPRTGLWYATLLREYQNHYGMISLLLDGEVKVTEAELRRISAPATLPPVTHLFQTGHLTVAGYDEATGVYTLRIPNLTVHREMTHFVLSQVTWDDWWHDVLLPLESPERGVWELKQGFEKLYSGGRFAPTRRNDWLVLRWVLYAHVQWPTVGEPPEADGRSVMEASVYGHTYRIEIFYEDTYDAKPLLARMSDWPLGKDYAFKDEHHYLLAILLGPRTHTYRHHALKQLD